MALRKYWTLAAESPLLSSSVPLRKASTALPERARSWTETTVSLRGDCARVPVENGKTITVKKKAAGFMGHHLDVVAFSVRGEARCARADSSGVIFNAILEPVRLNPDVPAKLEETIDKALEKDRNLRYQHASEMRAD
jgi:hypothetical protein